jgi:hypothetical protein
MLSKEGKEVLIKVVAQAIPRYVMGCFDIAKEVCDQIRSLIARYWWSDQDNDNRIHWLSKEILSLPKGWGGIGFRDIHTFNLVMLAKQVWRLIHRPNSLCANILRVAYFPNGDVLNPKHVKNMSYTWRSILKGLKVIKNGMIWSVGDGTGIKIWSDPWLLRTWTRKHVTPRQNNLISRIEELLDTVTRQWDRQLADDIFVEEDAKLILSIPVHTDLRDIVAWHYDTKGLFPVRSAYKVQGEYEKRATPRGKQSTSHGAIKGYGVWKRIWKLNCPGKIKHFLWRLAHDTLALRIGLQRKGMDIGIKCVICNKHFEDGGHLFLKCKYVCSIWQELGMESVRLSLISKESAIGIMEAILDLGRLKL